MVVVVVVVEKRLFFSFHNQNDPRDDVSMKSWHLISRTSLFFFFGLLFRYSETSSFSFSSCFSFSSSFSSSFSPSFSSSFSSSLFLYFLLLLLLLLLFCSEILFPCCSCCNPALQILKNQDPNRVFWIFERTKRSARKKRICWNPTHWCGTSCVCISSWVCAALMKPSTVNLHCSILHDYA